MADLDVTIAVEAINNARGPLAEAAAQLEQLEAAIRGANAAGGQPDVPGAAPPPGSLDAAGPESHALLAEAATNAALALQMEAMGHAEVNLLLGEGLAARQALSETMLLLEAQTLAYQTGLLTAAAAGKQLGVTTQIAAGQIVEKMHAVQNSVGAVAKSFAAATTQANRLRQAILSMQNVRVSASIRVSGLGGEAAGGGQFVTSGPTLLVVGDNPGGRERVSVEPLSGRGQTRIAPGGGVLAAAGGVEGAGASQRVQIVVPVLLDGVEVGRGAIEGTLDALQQRGVVEGVVGG